MGINQVNNAESWRKLLAYYTDCLREENRLRYVIKPKDIRETCFFLPSISGDFLREESLSLALTSSNTRYVEALQRFVLGDPRSTRHPSVSFGYPFFVDSDGKQMPLLYSSVSGRRIDGGVGLTRESVEIGINFAAIWEVLPSEKEIGLDEVFDKFDALKVKAGESRFDRTLALLVSQIEEIAGSPLRRVSREEFDPRKLPHYAIVECPLLFHVSDRYTYQLLRELNQLLRWHDWDEVQPALRQLLTQTARTPYPEVPELASDPRLYVVPANDSQRRVVAAASQYPLTVVTGPPGTGKSQLIVNIVGNAVLRGETVLIASRNNRAVDVVHDRFLGQVDYPGTVRSGRLEYRRQLPALMRRVLGTVHRGSMGNRLEQARGDYDDLLHRIEEQRKIIADTEGLLRDRKAYQAEMRDLAGSLPEPLGKSVGKARISLTAAESNKLKAALRTLEEETVALVERRQALAEELKAVIVENRERLTFLKQVAALERRSGVSLESMRPDTSVEGFSAIEGYLTAWESLVAAVSLRDKACGLGDKVTDSQREAKEAQKGLPAELIAELDDTIAPFDVQQEQVLRQSLEGLEKDTQVLVDEYHRLIERLASVENRSSAVRSLFELMAGSRAADSVSPHLDLVTLKRMFEVKDDALEAHQAGMVRGDLQRRLKALEQEKQGKLAEFEAILADLDGQLTAARAEVPVILITQIEAVSEQEGHKAWENATAVLSQLDEWCNRVRNGQLTLLERLQRIFSPNWALHRLRRSLRSLRASLADLGVLDLVDEPAEDELFEEWVDHVHRVTCFVRACSLVARRRYLLEQREAYREQVEREIVTVSAELGETDIRFMNALTRLPDAIADAMLKDAWPFETIDPALARDLETAKDQYNTLASQYAAAVERLSVLQQDHAPSEYLRTAIQALKLGASDGQPPASGVRPTPTALMNLVSAWVRFSYATEAEHNLRQAQRVLRETEEELDQVLARLPAEACKMDFTAIRYSDKLVQTTESALAALRAKLKEQLDEWRALQERAIGLLQDNTLEIGALSKALKQAKKDPDYLAGLVGHSAYERPEQLLDLLHLWKLAIGVWDIQLQLSNVSRKLQKYPPLEEATVQQHRMLEERVPLAGQVLTEKWRQTAAELDPDAIRSIGYYVDAIEALANNTGPRGTLKKQAERYFADALKLFPIWSTTNLSTQDLPLQAGLFDCVVIDEASQCDIPSALPLLFRARRIVIIGDDQQLTHIATLPKPIHRQLSERYDIGSHYSYRDISLFRLASSSTARVPGPILLDEHYRSHEEIIEFSNRNFYDRALRLRTDLSKIPALYQTRGCGVFWVDVKGCARRPGPGQIFNREEQQTVTTLVRRLLEQLDSLGMDGAGMGIVTPFRAQADNIRKAVRRLSVPDRHVLVGTIHTYQGNERDIMIFSTVATEDLPEGTLRFMTSNPNLLNVAVTRARLTLIVIGDHNFFMSLPKSSCYYKLAAYAKDLGKVYPNLEYLPLFQPIEDDEKFIRQGIAIRPDTPYSNRMTLRRLLASCQDYLWWYDPYMSIHALDALALALSGLEGQIREVRLLTSEEFWGNREYLTKKTVIPLKRELEARGIRLQLAVTSRDRGNPPPHDRYLFSANQAVNMPPIRNIYQDIARLAEFLPSTVKPEEFESWWQRAKVVLG